MKSRVALIPTTLLLALGSFSAAQSSQSLPDSPSATVQQKQSPPPAAPAGPAQTSAAPAQPSAPQTAPAASDSKPATSGAHAAPAATGTSAPASQLGASQLPPPPDAEDLPIFRTRVDEVNVIFTVTDKHGRFVKNLVQNDFRVVDDNKPAQQVIAFRSETNLPLRVALLVDASNSVRDRFRFEQEAAIEFLNQVVRRKYDRAFVLGFDTTAEVTQDFTDDTEQLSRGVRMLRPGGGTAMFDAIYFACRDKLMKADQGGAAVRRAMILLSDGEDNQSRVTREEAIEMAQRAEVIIYSISTNVSGMKLRGDKVLERIAEATGGRAFFPFKIQDVANAFSDIQDELRSQYAIAYKPADFKSDGRYRPIEILAENHKSLHVRARKGYFAPRQ